MKNTIASMLFILLVTGMLFTGCSKTDDGISDDGKGQLEESVMGGLEGDGDSDGDSDGNEENSTDENDDGDDDAEGPDDEDANNTSNSTSTPATTTTTSTSTTQATYKDGTYAADGTYSSPGGSDTVSVSLVVKNDVVESVTVKYKSGDPTSKAYIENFAGNISALVVGKPLSSLGSLGAVSGASLTPKGFNSAIQTIQSLAQA